jgi:hypothetical protein
MKLLVAGNSQAGPLHEAVINKYYSVPDGVEIDFYVVPGGAGPRFTIVGRRLVVLQPDEKFPARFSSDDVPSNSIDEYDGILVSALGYVDGGYGYSNPVVRQGILPQFRPKNQESNLNYISNLCLRDIVTSNLLSQRGFRFLEELSKKFGGIIGVQPFPYLSSATKVHENWTAANLYEDPLGFHRLLTAYRIRAVEDACASAGAFLLPIHPLSDHENYFTPAELMRSVDGVHAGPKYGAFVLEKMVEILRTKSDSRSSVLRQTE